MAALTGSQLVGLTFGAAQVTEGVAVQNPDGSYAYTVKNLVSTFAPGGSATVTSASGNTVTVTLHGGIVNGQTVTGTLVANDSGDFLFSGTIPGFGSGFVYVTNTVAQQPAVNGTVTVQPLGASNPYSAPPCFAAGTRVATPDGLVAVEALRIGQRVDLARGGTAEITWIGQRTLSCRRHPDPASVQPVRIAAGAFADQVPFADLLLSPEHCVFTGGVLVPVKCLLNGVTVAQADIDQVTYYHVELATHDVLLAEGLPVESYLDAGNRSAFEGGAAYLQLHPDFSPRTIADACAEIVVDGPGLAAIRGALLDRVTAVFGYRISRDTDLSVLADGVPCAVAVFQGTHSFIVPANPGEVRIVSRNAVAADLEAVPGDRRRLGAAISAVRLNGHVLSLNHPDLADIFHEGERSAGLDWRWTDGDAAVPASLFAKMATTRLELDVVTVQPGWERAA